MSNSRTFASVPWSPTTRRQKTVGFPLILNYSQSRMDLAAVANCTTLQCFVPELQNLSPYAPNGIGLQDFTRGCLLALNESLVVQDGKLAFSNDTCFFNNPPSCDNITIIQDAAIYGPICGMNASAPEVIVPYYWCERNCPGWQKSELGSLSQWIGPLVQFILPCLAFCLSIPRSWKFAVPSFVFSAENETLDSLVTYVWQLPIALLVVTFDTTFWLSTCFAFAGPMLLSAMYEYTLDRKIIDLFSDKLFEPAPKPAGAIPTFLLCTLVGNLKLEIPQNASSIGGIQPNGIECQSTNPASASQPSQAQGANRDLTWKHIMQIADDFKPQSSHNEVERIIQQLWDGPQTGHARNNLQKLRNLLEKRVEPDYKLKALLNAQSSFGGAVGAPVIFFIGGFIYNVIDALSSPGDQNTALSLAFGMWWMVIPHTAVITCAMLASNNPSTLQGIIGRVGDTSQLAQRNTGLNVTGPAAAWRKASMKFGQRIGSKDKGCRFELVEKLSKMIENAYDSDFEPVALWRRGPNKQRWIDEAIKMFDAPGRWPSDGRGTLDTIKEKFRLNSSNWIVVIATLHLVLLGVPFAFAFTTSFLTPQYGLSCRSMTHLTYFVTQILQMALWVPIYYIDRTKISPYWVHLARILQLLTGSCAVIAAVGGTLMQIIGVYNNCICKVNIPYWLDFGSPRALVSLSQRTQAGVQSAHYWVTFGGTVAGVLGAVTAIAWWHQRRLRRKFLELLKKMRTHD